MAENENQNPEQQTQNDVVGGCLSKCYKYFKRIIILMIVWQVISYFISSNLPQLNPSSSGSSSSPGPSKYSQLQEDKSKSSKSFHFPIFRSYEKLRFTIFLSNSKYFSVNKTNRDDFLWEEYFLNSHTDFNTKDFSLNITNSTSPNIFNSLVYNNESLYIHFYISREKKRIIENSNYVLHTVFMVNKYYKDRIYSKRKLIGGEDDDIDEGDQVKDEGDKKGGDGVEEEKEKKKIVVNNYLYKDMYINLVGYDSPMPFVTTKAQFFVGMLDLNQNLDFFPIVYHNTFWNLKEKMIKLNDSITNLPLNIHFYSLPFWKFQLYIQLESSFNMQSEIGLSDDSDKEDIKRMIIGNPPWLLVLTMIVTLFHSLFDFLAFKSDVKFWRNKKDIHGISVKTIVWNCGSQVVIFLYLFNNDTSWTVLISSFIGLLIEFWKCFKAFKVEKAKKFPFFRIGNKSSYESETKKYDETAMKFLFYALLPLLIAYAIYNLLYNEHRSWYSYILKSLVGFIYAFGFIMMTPQLFINYKMQSVAHLNWRTMTYKVISTFIDDLFAVVVKAPLLHKIATLRDDVVFFVYVYQRWAYRVDKTRVNEYGQREDIDDKDDKKKLKNE